LIELKQVGSVVLFQQRTAHTGCPLTTSLPAATQYGVNFMGLERLLLPNDHPWVDPKQIKACLLTLGLPPPNERRLLGDHARKVFGLS
jgi:hypothetical protein